MSEQPIDHELPSHIFEAELGTIAERRNVAQCEPLPQQSDSRPSTQRRLVGLALSGGGIRSSTFSLGVIQALARNGTFRYVDYLSTVSGGGYTGALLSSLLNEPGDKTEAGNKAPEFPITKPEGEPEPDTLQHLRNGSNYLSPGGALNALRLPAIVIRGLVLNGLIVLPWLMFAVTLTEYLHEADWVARLVDTWNAQLTNESAPTVAILGGTALFLSYGLSTWASQSWRERNRAELLLAYVVIAMLAIILWVPMSIAIDAALETPLRGPKGLMTMLRDWARAGGWHTLTLLSGSAYFGLRASRNLSKLANKLLLYALGAVGPLTLFGIYLMMLVAQADSPYLPLEASGLTFPEPDPPALVHDLPLTAKLRNALETKGIKYDGGLATLPAVYSKKCGDGRDRPCWVVPQPASIDTSKILTDAAAIKDDEIEKRHLYRFRLDGQRVCVIGARLRMGGDPNPQTLMSDVGFGLLALELLLLNFLLLDVNRSSLHGFYRDRLSRLYLIRRRPGAGVQHVDRQLLSALNVPGSAAPYHLINTTLNLQGSTSEALLGRGGDFFTFSKHYTGSPHTGYCPTREIEKRDPHIDLGTAMAISAAAAAPNMGSTTIRPLVFALTMLNLRLDYWVPNPRGVLEPSSVRFRQRRPGALYLLREAWSALSARTAWVNVSDGGHLENLGIYELLRRRCALVLAVDGGADPTHTFGGLVTLIRLANIDLGIRIDIDLTSLRLDPNRRSGAHFVKGTIDYGRGEHGQLLYIKSSYTTDEDPFLTKYRAENPDFPHQTTADQFFNEAQFEAYRALGMQVGEALYGSPLTQGMTGFSAASPQKPLEIERTLIESGVVRAQ